MDLSSIGFIPNSPRFIDKGLPLCAQVDPELFFPQENEFHGVLVSSTYYDETGAKEICNSCPYKARCLDYALSQGERVAGIWGGTNELERRKIRRQIAHAKNRAGKTEVK